MDKIRRFIAGMLIDAGVSLLRDEDLSPIDDLFENEQEKEEVCGAKKKTS